MNLNQHIEDWLTTRKASFQSANRPFVTLAYAQGWGGSITTKQGQGGGTEWCRFQMSDSPTRQPSRWASGRDRGCTLR